MTAPLDRSEERRRDLPIGASGAGTMRSVAVIAARLRQLGELGYEQAALGVDSENPGRAFALYESLGYEVNNFSEVPDVDTLVLEGWLGRSPDDDTRHRLALMRDLHRLFYGSLMLSEFIGRRAPEAELTAPTPDEFRAAIMRGELRGTPELLSVLGRMHLVGFAAAQGS